MSSVQPADLSEKGGDQTAAEAVANESVPADAEGLSLADEPMLCPPACIAIAAAAGGGFAAGAAVGCVAERCLDSRPEMTPSEQNLDFETDSSVDEIIGLVDE